MRILYDYQILFLQKYGGISRYYFELITRFSKKNKYCVDISCIGSQNFYFEKFFQKPARSKEYTNKTRRLINKVNQFITLLKLKGEFDIFHPTYYQPYMVGKYKGKMVLTVYDMIQERFPKQFPEIARKDKDLSIHAADHLIAISNSTKKDIMSIYIDIPEDKISVIYIGTDMKKCMNESLKLYYPNKYILFVGQRRGYKNFDIFAKATRYILAEDEEINIVCTGGGEFIQEDYDLMGDYGDRFHHLNCNDEMLSAAYTYAELFVFPSKYEGFGIPTLEAFSCDCPVILSNTSSMPEVGGDAAIYFNPESEEELIACIRKGLNDNDLRMDLVKKGKDQLKKFDWDEIAEKTYQCYRRVANE